MKNARKLIGLFAFATIALAAPFALATEGVSPGAGDRLAVIQDGCPAFSWGEVDGAAFYEVVAYRLPEGEDFVVSAGVELSKENEVLYTRVAGAATAWTPSLERCFVSGGSYVWFVRAVFDEDGTPAAGDWSEGLFFSVATAPSAAEVRQALGVLQRYLEEGGGGNEELAAVFSGTGTGTGTGAIGTTRNAGTIKVAGRALPGTAAIRGEQPDPTGETYGVYGITSSSTDGSLGVVGEATAATGEAFGVGGITASVDGAGVIAFNSANGTDLILGADSSSAHLTELGLTRSVPGPAIFDISNPDGAGAMTLRVDGVDVVTTATDQDALGGLSCASGELPKWNGSVWACEEDLDTDTLAGMSCASGELAKWNGSQWACDDDLDTDTLAGLGCVHDQIARWNTVLGAWECSDDVDTDTDTLGALACGPDQIVKWSGTFWYCSPDEDTTYNAGNQVDLVGTTFNVVEGSGSGLDADTLDTHNTGYFATSVHDHLGQTWTGSAPHGLKVENSAPGVTSGVFGNSSSVDGYGGYFENTDGGVDIMAGGSGDVAQVREGNGLVKAAASFTCDENGSTIWRSFNNVPGAGPITIAWDWDFPVGCVIDFGFNVRDRFWSTGNQTGVYLVGCGRGHLSLTDSELFCTGEDGSDYTAMILVY